ncbi:hypothetical protein NKG05_19150 [Oerskovia sp. M15]
MRPRGRPPTTGATCAARRCSTRPSPRPSPSLVRHPRARRRAAPAQPALLPAQIIGILEREYLMVIGAAGGAVGAAAAFPAVGTGVGIALTASDVATFFGSSAAFSLAVADVYGFEVDDAGRRRALLMASVLGDKGSQAVEKASGGSALAWGKVLMTSMPSSTLKQVNKALTNKFMRTQMVKHGGLALGRLVPFGVGPSWASRGARTRQDRDQPVAAGFRPAAHDVPAHAGGHRGARRRRSPLLVPAPADRLSLVDAPVPGAGPGVVDAAAERAAAERAAAGRAHGRPAPTAHRGHPVGALAPTQEVFVTAADRTSAPAGPGRVELTHVLPLDAERAFALVADVRTHPRWCP